MRDKLRSWLSHTATALLAAVIASLICWPLLNRDGSVWCLALFASASVLFSGLIATFRHRAPRPETSAPLQHALRSLGDGVLLADVNGKVVYLNPAAESLVGWTREEAAGQAVDQVMRLVDEASCEPLHGQVTRALRDNVLVVCNNRALLQARDGSEKAVDFTAAPVREGNKSIRGVAVVFRDLTAVKHAQQAVQKTEELRRLVLDQKRTTELERLNDELRQEVRERKQTEEELQRAMEVAEAASAAKSSFLANVSHEIRTPMNGILGMTQLALAEEASPRLRSRLRVIQESANALLLLVNDLLDYAKMEAGKFQIHPEPFDLQQEIISTAQMLTDRAKQKGLELTCRIAPDVPSDVNGDGGRLRQILLNLIGNAIKFTKQGSVAVEVRVLERTEPNVRLWFEVRDTGIGIPGEMMQRIFSPFVQGDSSTTRQYGGTGLGLSIARNLVEMMGGKIEVESTVAKGSAFRFTVLVALETAAAINLPKSVLNRLKNLTALVIDDNVAQRLMTMEMCKKWGVRLTGAAVVAEAVEYMQAARLSKQAFDIVLLDECVGGEAGTAIARKLRQGHGCKSPIILLGSGGANENGAWIATCVNKPFTPSDLLEAIAITLQFSTFEIQIGRGAEPPLSIGQPPPKPLNILVAEDNHFNQVVAQEMLHKVGHQVTLATNGREAVEVVEKKRFDVVLMDVQMPEMDGLEATALIRSREKGRGSRLPIIAMTAHAMKGDEEACLRAGMDGYLCKPVNQQQLHREIARVLNGEPAAAPPALAAPVPKEDKVDLRPQPDRRDQRRQRMLELFRVEAPRMVAEIRGAVTTANAERLCRAAHKLCGAVGYLAAPDVEVAARRLEALGREGDLAPTAAALTYLEECLARFDPALGPASGLAKPQGAGAGK
jgi:two-component system sensor histidine kinase/response regulator